MSLPDAFFSNCGSAAIHHLDALRAVEEMVDRHRTCAAWNDPGRPTTTNNYTAIMRAADSIEREPGRYNFGAGGIPGQTSFNGCALGWIGHHLRWPAEAPSEMCSFFTVAAILVTGSPKASLDPIIPEIFYRRMNHLTGLPADFPHCAEGASNSWYDNPHECARGLRLYAEAYHSHENPNRPLPRQVRAVFDQRAEVAHV